MLAMFACDQSEPEPTPTECQHHIFKDDNYDGDHPSEKIVTFDNGVCIVSASTPAMNYPKDIRSYLGILISANNNQLAPGTYEIQPDRNVTGGMAYISIIYPFRESYTVTAESGQLTVTITDEGMINVNYKDVSATGHSIGEPPEPVGYKLTGDLTFCANFQ